MKIFAEANILVSVINKEYPLFQLTSRIVSLEDSQRFSICTSPICIAIAFYFAEKKYRAAAKDKIQLLCSHIGITQTTATAVRSALADPAVKDLEDGLEYYSALEAGCDCIVTEDKKGFYFSQLEVLSSLDFYEKYMMRKKA
jgi:predicted nucleic acid-binding protein